VTHDPKRIAKHVYVAGLLAMMAAEPLNVIMHDVRDVPLAGVEITATAPELSLARPRGESFQHDAVTWFDQRWDLLGTLRRREESTRAAHCDPLRLLELRLEIRARLGRARGAPPVPRVVMRRVMTASVRKKVEAFTETWQAETFDERLVSLALSRRTCRTTVGSSSARSRGSSMNGGDQVAFALVRPAQASRVAAADLL